RARPGRRGSLRHDARDRIRRASRAPHLRATRLVSDVRPEESPASRPDKHPSRADGPGAAARERIAIAADDGGRLALHRTGPRNGAPVVLIPGTFSSHPLWLGTRGAGFARDLAQHGYEAWVLDPRGQGLSERPGRSDVWRFDDWARRDAPAAIAAALASRAGFVIGHSAGGAAALVAISTRPDLRERMRGLAALGTPFPWLQPFSRIGAHTLRTISKVLG